MVLCRRQLRKRKDAIANKENMCSHLATEGKDASKSRGGRLYACGRTFLNGYGPCHPLAAADIDCAGHTPLPRPFICKGANAKLFQNARFSDVRGEYSTFAALELCECEEMASTLATNEGGTESTTQVKERVGRASPPSGSGSVNKGRVWAWGGGVSIHPCTFRDNHTNDPVVSFDVGGNTVFAVTESGILFSGSPKSDQHGISATVELVPFVPSPPHFVRSVAASEGNVAVICQVDSSDRQHAEECTVYTFGKGPSTGFTDPRESTPVSQWRRLMLVGPNGTFKKDAWKISMGSLNGAAVCKDGTLYVWGDGMSGSLGCGVRANVSPSGYPLLADLRGELVSSVACTKAQPNPKRLLVRRSADSSTRSITSPVFESGQEGPRCHAITTNGSLWICGTSHKGLAANCMFKALSPGTDALAWYRVGSEAVDLPRARKSPETTDQKRPPECFSQLLAGTFSSSVPTGALEMAIRDVRRRAREDQVQPPLSSVYARQLGVDRLSDLGYEGRTNYLTERGLRVVQTSVAHIHSAAVSSDGRCFMWGCGSDGRLGLSCFFDAKGSKRLLKCYVSSPTSVDLFEERRQKVLSVAAFRFSTCFVVED